MIIFFNKQTGELFGRIDGRIHDNPEKEMVKPGNINKKDIGRYVVPFKKVFKEEKVPIKKWFFKNGKGGEVEERVVGHEKQKIPNGLAPDVDFASLILDFESGKENIYNYIVVLEKNKVIGFKVKMIK